MTTLLVFDTNSCHVNYDTRMDQDEIKGPNNSPVINTPNQRYRALSNDKPAECAIKTDITLDCAMKVDDEWQKYCEDVKESWWRR